MSLLESAVSHAGSFLYRIVAPFQRRRRHRYTLKFRAANQPSPPAGAWWAQDTRWFAGGTPPRPKNEVQGLIDGERYFRVLTEELQKAKDYVFIIDWCLTPQIPLLRETSRDLIDSRLLTVLSKTASRVPVRILLWSGAPAALQPTQRVGRYVQSTIKREGIGDIDCRLDYTARFTHCHHQKAVVIDGQVAFVGGMDLTTFAGDRWDTSKHQLRSGPNWHDVQLMLRGEAVADVEHNFRQRWIGAGGKDDLPHREPEVNESWSTPVQVIRTIPKRTYQSLSQGERGIHHMYVNALRQAKDFVYIENQYLWSPHVIDIFRDLVARPPSDRFRVAAILPAKADEGKMDNDKHVQELRELDNGRGIISVYCLYTSGPKVGLEPFYRSPIYVHAKVAIIDDEWLSAGSANLNNRGLITDGEMNLAIKDPAVARSLRLDLWSEHLGMPRSEIEQCDAATCIDRIWKEQAAINEKLMSTGQRPLIGSLYPYKTGKMPGTWLLEEVEGLTLEH
jgi:phosphatidylserine/phosphatidylglycerophosphate/cardiolipin synthase-like enzyme